MAPEELNRRMAEIEGRCWHKDFLSEALFLVADPNDNPPAQ